MTYVKNCVRMITKLYAAICSICTRVFIYTAIHYISAENEHNMIIGKLIYLKIINCPNAVAYSTKLE